MNKQTLLNNLKRFADAMSIGLYRASNAARSIKVINEKETNQ